MTNYSLCESSPNEERLLSMFVLEALKKRLLRKMRATARATRMCYSNTSTGSPLCSVPSTNTAP
jgi:hypothetical protein